VVGLSATTALEVMNAIGAADSSSVVSQSVDDASVMEPLAVVPPLPDGWIEEIVDLSSDDEPRPDPPFLPSLSESDQDDVIERKPDRRPVSSSLPEVARDPGSSTAIKLEPVKLTRNQYMCTHCGAVCKRRYDASRHMDACRARKDRQTAARATVSTDSRPVSVSQPSPSPTDAQSGEAVSVKSDPGSHSGPARSRTSAAKPTKPNRRLDGVETFIPERKPTTPAKVYAPAAKKARQSAAPRQTTAAEEATSPARFSHQSFGRIVATFSHLSDDDLMSELQRRMPRVPLAMLASHLDTARAVLSNCSSRLSLAAGMVNEPSARVELSQLIRDWGCPDV